MYKAPPPEISSEQFYETDESRGFARGFSIQTISPLPIGWAEHVLADGHWGQCAARVHARLQPLDGPRVALRASAASGEPRHARRRGRLERHAGRALQLLARATTTAPTSPTRRRCMNEIWDDAGAQDTLTIDRYAHLVGGCRMGFAPRGQRRRRDAPGVGSRQPLRVRRQRLPDAGSGEPGARDHGARRPPRRLARCEAHVRLGAERGGAEGRGNVSRVRRPRS